MPKIRKAQNRDLPAIVNIYNQAICRGFCTADTETYSVKEKKEWFLAHDEQYPVYVYETDDKIVGWLSVSPYRKGRKALRYTAEVSYYIDENFQRQGIGSRLLQYTIDKMAFLNFRTYIAILLDVNIASIQLLEKLNFQKWAHLPDVADFDGKACGQYYYGYQTLNFTGIQNG